MQQRINPDIAFVQEALEPKNLPPDRVIWRPIGANSRFGERRPYDWATGIYSKEKLLRPLVAGELGDGWVVVAETDTSEGPITLISIHVEIVNKSATATLDRILTELTPLLEQQDRLIVLGGDLNVDERFDGTYKTRRHSRVIERVESFGLFHCNSLLPKGVRTFVRYEPPIQDDHFFISETLASRVSCDVLDDEDMRQFSDHYPVILELQDAG